MDCDIWTHWLCRLVSSNAPKFNTIYFEDRISPCLQSCFYKNNCKCVLITYALHGRSPHLMSSQVPSYLACNVQTTDIRVNGTNYWVAPCDVILGQRNTKRQQTYFLEIEQTNIWTPRSLTNKWGAVCCTACSVITVRVGRNKNVTLWLFVAFFLFYGKNYM